jgi:branched-subunit amino acid aminotransferase/4-amino-4-deoxychorismate lyase
MEAYLNGEFLPLDQARLHVGDLAIQRGYGIFDFFRVRDFVPLYLDDYLNRFYRSAEAMGLKGVPSRDDLRSAILELIERNGMPDAGMKLILTGGYSPDAYQPVEGNLAITEHELHMPTAEQINKGIAIITHEYRREFPEIKTINYLTGVWLQRRVKESNAADVLYHRDGAVTEFPRCNFFIVSRDGVLATPDTSVLHGITRMRVLEVAATIDRPEARRISLSEVFEASEAFLTSTTKRILPIVSVDGKTIGSGIPGPVTRNLIKLLAERESQEVERSRITVRPKP